MNGIDPEPTRSAATAVSCDIRRQGAVADPWLRVLRDYGQLVKPRVAVLVLITTAAGFYLGTEGPLHLPVLLHVIVGTALVAASANALNQLHERRTDALMHRTADRPLPTGRMEPGEVLFFGIVAGVAGVLYLIVTAGVPAGIVAAATLGGYVFAYTPLKARTSLSTVVGAVPGALPPLIGWVAAGRGLDGPAWILFAIVFFWQIPHFLAIAWMYREDYARAGLPLLTVIDPTGTAAARQVALYSAALVPPTLAPALMGWAGTTYLVVAIVLSGLFLAFAVRMVLTMSLPAARALFRYSIVHLTVLMVVLMIDKVN